MDFRFLIYTQKIYIHNTFFENSNLLEKFPLFTSNSKFRLHLTQRVTGSLAAYKFYLSIY